MHTLQRVHRERNERAREFLRRRARHASVACLMTRKGGERMDVLLVCDEGVERHAIEDLPRLLERRDAVVWVDIPVCDEQAVNVLSGVFGFHPIAVRDCTERNHVSKVHIYPDYVFSVLHAPKIGKGGHVHYVELDQFVGQNYLVTVHGPLNPAVAPEVCSPGHPSHAPPSGTTAGFITSTLIIIILASVLFITFKRKGWL
jgi:Mg2+ and Co2+ transporter CorA